MPVGLLVNAPSKNKTIFLYSEPQESFYIFILFTKIKKEKNSHYSPIRLKKPKMPLLLKPS